MDFNNPIFQCITKIRKNVPCATNMQQQSCRRKFAQIHPVQEIFWNHLGQWIWGVVAHFYCSLDIDINNKKTVIFFDDFRIFLELDEFAKICGDGCVVAYLLHMNVFLNADSYLFKASSYLVLINRNSTGETSWIKNSLNLSRILQKFLCRLLLCQNSDRGRVRDQVI